jgi:hypothetical protein
MVLLINVLKKMACWSPARHLALHRRQNRANFFSAFNVENGTEKKH